LGAALVTLTIQATPANAADFSPSADYHLCTEDSGAQCVHGYDTDSAVQFRIELAQDEGEEEIQHIRLEFAPGFRFPTDEDLENGERLGTAHIETAAGPGCMGAVGTVPIAIDGHFEERDRTEDEINDGVRVVFRLNLDPTPPIDIKVYGNERNGHRVEAALEDRSATCPTFSFNGTFFAQSEGSGTPLLRTPAKPGKYSLKAIFTGTQESVVAYRYPYRFTP
jgi:hypothetical protein